MKLKRKTHKLIETFPVVLRHQSKGTQQRPAEVIEVGVAVVRIRTSDNARIIDRALTARQTGPREQNYTLQYYANKLIMLHYLVQNASVHSSLFYLIFMPKVCSNL